MLLVLAGLSALSVGAPGEDLKDTFYDSVVAKSVLPPPVTSHRNRKIWVGVLINDEIDLLKVAVNLYVGHVSGIDVVQAPITISGRPKPLHLHPEPSMRDAVLRIEKLHVHTLGSTSNATRSGFATEDFRVETQMRRRLGAELVARASPDDCVVTPDLDELLHPEALHAACARLTDDQVVQFGLMWFHTSMWQLGLPNTWNIKAMVTARALKSRFNSDPGAVRSYAGRGVVVQSRPARQQCYGEVVRPVGWHCSWCFARRDQFANKLRSSAHVAYARYATDDSVLDGMACGGHWLDMGMHGKVHFCRALPNGSETLLTGCARRRILAAKQRASNAGPEATRPSTGTDIMYTVRKRKATRTRWRPSASRLRSQQQRREIAGGRGHLHDRPAGGRVAG